MKSWAIKALGNINTGEHLTDYMCGNAAYEEFDLLEKTNR